MSEYFHTYYYNGYQLKTILTNEDKNDWSRDIVER